MIEPSDREVAVFNAARKLAAEARPAFLAEACACDAALRQRIEELLRANEEAGAFLQEPADGARRPAEASAAPHPPREAAPPAEKVGDRIGRYKLLQQIGEGGCGVVYMADQEEPVRRRVALKVIKLGMDTKQVIARFEAERQAVALMDHPNIAKVLDAGATETGRPYFVMELVRGIKITEYCDDNNLSTGDRLGLFIQICQAIQHAHQKGVIHRDIKPSNILVTVNDGVAVPKVIDFGIAKATQGRLTDQTLFTAFEQFIGTPAYMSPEQAMMTSLDIDTRSDIYSLGVLLYELLTGRTPFDSHELLASGLEEMRRTIREKEPLWPSTRLSTLVKEDLTITTKRRQIEPLKLLHLVRGDLDWIVMKCLEKDRARRYETANGLAMDLQRCLADEPVMARPPSNWYRFQKLVKRNELVFGATGVIVAVLVLGVSGSSWQAIRATRAEAEQSRLKVLAQREQAKAGTSMRAERQERLRADRERLAAQRNLYVANMNLAQQAWEQDDVEEVRQLLDEAAAYPERGFEWYYWQRQIRTEQSTLRGHFGAIWAVAFSPDGRRLVTAAETAKLWDVGSGRELLTFLEHQNQVTSVSFSSDGQRIVTGSLDGNARVWDSTSGRALLTLTNHGFGIYAVAFAPDGRRIATGGFDRAARVWDGINGAELLTLQGHSNMINAVAFSPDGGRIVTGSVDGTARVWDATNGQQLMILTGHQSDIMSVAFSPKGDRILTAGYDLTGRLWDAHNGRELLTLRGHTGKLNVAGFSPDGRRIITGSEDRTARIWDARSGTELQKLKGHTFMIYGAAYSPNGRQVATGSWDHTVKIWDSVQGSGPRLLKGHKDRITAVSFSNDGQRLVTASWDQTAKVWNVGTGEQLLTFTGHRARVQSAAFSGSGQQVVTASDDLTAKVWDAGLGRSDLPVSSAIVSLAGHRDTVWSVVFSPTSPLIVTASGDHTAGIWDPTTGKQLRTLKGHLAEIVSLAFFPDGRRLLTGSYDGTAKVWDTETGSEWLTLSGHSGWVKSVAVSRDGMQIATGGADQLVRVWTLPTGAERVVLKGHGAMVTSTAFSPDGQRILTSGADGTARVWDVATAKEMLILRAHRAAEETSNGVTTAVWSPDGERIATGMADGTVAIWEAASAAQVNTWLTDERAATQRLAAHQREVEGPADQVHALLEHDEGAIKDWLVLLPIPFPGRDGNKALVDEQVAHEGQLQPKPGDRVTIGDTELTWRAVHLEDYLINFERFLGAVTEWSVVYAIAYIQSDASRSGLILKLGSDDQSRAYLNGKLIYQSEAAHPYIADHDVVPGVELKAGLNVLIFKVVNESGGWEGSIRLTDDQGNPITGIKVLPQVN